MDAKKQIIPIDYLKTVLGICKCCHPNGQSVCSLLILLINFESGNVHQAQALLSCLMLQNSKEAISFLQNDVNY